MSQLGTQSAEGYCSKVTAAETLSEDGSDTDGDSHMKDGPFSALTPSMWPQDCSPNFSPPEDESGQVDYRYNEFGFKVEVEDGPEENSSKLLSTPFIEDPKHRLKWIAFLEFSHNCDMTSFNPEQTEVSLTPSQKLHDMITQHGIPHSLRPFIWPRLCGAVTKKQKSSQTYPDIVKASSIDNLVSSKQIEKDLLRTLPNNACFCGMKSTGIARLRRILRGIAWLYPDIGYCQGMGVVVASLLLYMEEEEVFWLTCTVIEDMLPASYYSSSLLGVQADQRVLSQLITSYLPELDSKLKKLDVDGFNDLCLPGLQDFMIHNLTEISLITLHWFLTVFGSVLHPRILLRVWDLFFYHGSVVLFQITLGMLKMKLDQLIACENSSQMFNVLSELPSTIDDVDELIAASKEIAQSLKHGLIESHRRKHSAYLMADQGAILNPEQANNLPKQQLNKRQITRSHSIFDYLWGDWGGEDAKAKNIKQTELLVDFRAAVLKIGRHFQSLDPDNEHINLTADYSLESHSLDLDRYVSVVQRRRRRAKALVDFERHDHDELGFKKNDVINLISMSDEHCWIGELRGLVGWFPAKFVEVLDERSKDYTSAGDDSVSAEITDLVRGTFCSAMKAIFEHGMKRSMIMGGSSHPWLFIEEASRKEIEKDFRSVYARLVLCKTFRLEEDGKVLTPEEVLYKSVQAVNATHDTAHAQMDVKFRSLICCGLNEQVLHLWLESLCSSEQIVRKWYHSWSFLRSPGWVQIKCDLRLLGQFAFILERDQEIAKKAKDWEKAFVLNVQEMLTKYHLFSWEMGS